MIRFLAEHPTAATLLMMGFIVAGLVSWPTLQRETFPRIEPRRIEVRVMYPGARPEDVEEAICQRIEDSVDGVNNVHEIICEANEGIARAEIEMQEGEDFDRFTADIKTEIEAIDDFPADTELPTIRQIGRTDFVASVAVTGPSGKPDLKAYAEELKEKMLRWGGIPKVDIVGFSDHQIRIELGDGVLRQFGLSVADIAEVIRRQSVDLPSGSLMTAEREILVRFDDERKTPAEFRDLVVVSSAGGGQVRLGDIATITDRFELDEQKIEFNGRPAAILDVIKTENEDTLDVIDAVNAFLVHERTAAPPGVDLAVTNDASSVVRDRLSLLVNNGAQGLILVFVTLWLFFGLRYSFWVAMGLPVSFLGAVAAMAMIGYSINMLTMAGLLIVIGLLMDDAIVIAENVASQRAKGLSAHDAAIEGTRQVLPSVFASFATTTCVFGSLAFIEGDIGAVLRVVPVVMLLVLVVSLVEAFLILPNHLAHSLANSGGDGGRVQKAVDTTMDWLRDRIVGPVAERAVAWRYLTLGIAIGALLLTMAVVAGGFLKFAAFPELEGNVMEARILLSQGTPLARTEAVAARVSAGLARVNEQLTKAQPGGQRLVRNVTLTYSENVDAHETGPNAATFTVDLLDSETRTVSIDEVMGQWRAETGEIPDVVYIKYTEPSVGPGGLAIEIRLDGDDLGQLQRAADDLQGWLGRYAGVHNLTADLRPGKPEIRARLKDGASTLGVDARMIADQLRTALYGATVREVQRKGESYEIDVRLDPRDRDSLADLDYFTIATPGGALIPLTEIAELIPDRGYSRINRIDRRRTVTVQGDVDIRVANANEILAATSAEFVPVLQERYPRLGVSLEGSEKEGRTTQASMLRGFLLGLIGVYLVLSFLLRSYIEPLAVMVIVPFALIGAVFGHILLGIDFTMPSILGFVALAGVVVNDSILLVNFTKHYHGDTRSVAEAAVMASRARFRAILLTSLTTIVGLLPILSETSLQAQVLIPLVTSLAFGLMASTLLVLFVVPAAYAVLDDFGLVRLD